MEKLSEHFYLRDDVLQISKDLLGKCLTSNVNGKKTQGIIVEIEAYTGVNDKASHAYGNRRTTRTEAMYQNGGIMYVYLCYGIHHLFNVVTNVRNIPHAILIRAIEPVFGIKEIIRRRNFQGKGYNSKTICQGPGNVSQGLGITIKNNGESLMENKIWIEDSDLPIHEKDIIYGPRIGVDYAGDDALLPYRFRINLS